MKEEAKKEMEKLGRNPCNIFKFVKSIQKGEMMLKVVIVLHEMLHVDDLVLIS